MHFKLNMLSFKQPVSESDSKRLDLFCKSSSIVPDLFWDLLFMRCVSVAHFHLPVTARCDTIVV